MRSYFWMLLCICYVVIGLLCLHSIKYCGVVSFIIIVSYVIHFFQKAFLVREKEFLKSYIFCI